MATCKAHYRGEEVALTISYNDNTLTVMMDYQQVGNYYVPCIEFYCEDSTLQEHMARLCDLVCNNDTCTLQVNVPSMCGWPDKIAAVSYLPEDMQSAIIIAATESYR